MFDVASESVLVKVSLSNPSKFRAGDGNCATPAASGYAKPFIMISPLANLKLYKSEPAS